MKFIPPKKKQKKKTTFFYHFQVVLMLECKFFKKKKPHLKFELIWETYSESVDDQLLRNNIRNVGKLTTWKKALACMLSLSDLSTISSSFSPRSRNFSIVSYCQNVIMKYQYSIEIIKYLHTLNVSECVTLVQLFAYLS